jgi:hypothetical protein
MKLIWLISLAILLTLPPMLLAYFPKYHLIKHPNQFYANDVASIHSVIHDPEHGNKLFVVWYTHDVEDSPYLIIYFEYIWALLNELNAIHIILDIKTHENEIVQSLLYDFPNNTLYIAIADAKASINPCMLSYIRIRAGYSSPLLFHLNHENPW